MHKALQSSDSHEWLTWDTNISRKWIKEVGGKSCKNEKERIRTSSRGPHGGYLENRVKMTPWICGRKREEDWKERVERARSGFLCFFQKGKKFQQKKKQNHGTFNLLKIRTHSRKSNCYRNEWERTQPQADTEVVSYEDRIITKTFSEYLLCARHSSKHFIC